MQMILPGRRIGGRMPISVIEHAARPAPDVRRLAGACEDQVEQVSAHLGDHLARQKAGTGAVAGVEGDKSHGSEG